MAKISTLIIALLPCIGAALAVVTTALHLIDPVIAALVLAVFITSAEAAAYTVLAVTEPKHSRAHGIMASAESLAAMFALALLLQHLGVWTLSPLAYGVMANSNGRIGRQIEHIDKTNRILDQSNFGSSGTYLRPGGSNRGNP